MKVLTSQNIYIANTTIRGKHPEKMPVIHAEVLREILQDLFDSEEVGLYQLHQIKERFGVLFK